MMTFSEKLMDLRRKSGLSQEQLADRLGVTRQSVSKWESGTAMPELVKLISLSDIFGVSVDYLVKDYLEEPESAGGGDDLSAQQAVRLEKKVDELTNYVKGRVYRFDSKTRIFGLPLVSIRFGFVRNGKLSMDNVARGIIAIGNAAIGVVAIGIVGGGPVHLRRGGPGSAVPGYRGRGPGGLRRDGTGVSGPGVSAPWGYTPAAWRPSPPRSPQQSPPCPHRHRGARLRQPRAAVGGRPDGPEVRAFLLEHHPDLWQPPAGPVLQPRRPYQVKFPLFLAGEQKSLTFVHRRAMLSAREGERSMRVSKAPEVRRQEILETAMKLFTEKGV